MTSSEKNVESFEALFMQQEGNEAWELYKYDCLFGNPSYKYYGTKVLYQDYLAGTWPYKEMPEHIRAQIAEAVTEAQEHEKKARDLRMKAQRLERGYDWVEEQ